MLKELLNDKISTDILKAAKVSQRELKEIKMLVAFDKDILLRESEMHETNELLQDNPYSYFVNFERLPKDIP